MAIVTFTFCINEPSSECTWSIKLMCQLLSAIMNIPFQRGFCRHPSTYVQLKLTKMIGNHLKGIHCLWYFWQLSEQLNVVRQKTALHGSAVHLKSDHQGSYTLGPAQGSSTGSHVILSLYVNLSWWEGSHITTGLLLSVCLARCLSVYQNVQSH